MVAVDGRGDPVTDLKKEDIVLTEQGQPREVVFFRFDGGIEKRDTEPLGPGLFTNRSEYTSGPPRNVMAIVVDGVFTPPGGQTTIRSQLLRYLDTIPPDTRVALYQAGYRLTVLHDFTSDLASLRSRIDSLLAVPPAHAAEFDDGTHVLGEDALISPDVRTAAMADMQRLEEQYQETAADRKRTAALAALEVVGDHLAGIPGRKSLVWMTVGMPIQSAYDNWRKVHDAQIRRTAERLASRGVSIYPVDVQGLVPPSLGTTSVGRGSSRGGTPPPRMTGLPDQRLWASMDLLADVTGGRVSKNTNDLTQGLKAAAADVRGSYTVAFYAAGTPDDKWHRLEIRTKRSGVRLTHRQGYLAEAPLAHTRDWSRDQWRWAAANPVGSTVMHLDARFERVKGAGDGTFGLVLLIAPEELHYRKMGDRLMADVQIAVVEKASNGHFDYRVRDTSFALPPQGPDTASAMMRYSDRWTVKPSTSIVRLIVRDRSTGRYGTLDMPVPR